MSPTKEQNIAVTYASPIGLLKIEYASGDLKRIARTSKKSPVPKVIPASLQQSLQQLTAYFAGKQPVFSVPSHLQGTAFQQKVWAETARIPLGKVATYSDIAQKIGHPQAVRAVGTALKKNPFCIVVPCHRVVPKSGGVGDYALGKTAKKWLLQREGVAF